MGVQGKFLYIWLIYALFGLNLGIRFEPVLGGFGNQGFKEIAPYTNMQMVRSNENNNIIYSNSMKINYWDEIYPYDKIYIRH